MNDPNIGILEIAVAYLGELVSEVVFVGGATVGLYLDDPAVPSVRPTEDVDCVVEVANLNSYYGLIKRLKALGFREDIESGIICRYLKVELILDVMPIHDEILSFSNRWYEDGVKNKRKKALPSGNSIFVFPLAYMVASKIEAFKGRGKGDFFASKDVEDIVALLDGATGFDSEMGAASSDVSQAVASELNSWVASPTFRSAVEGHIADTQNQSARAARILKIIAGL